MQTDSGKVQGRVPQASLVILALAGLFGVPAALADEETLIVASGDKATRAAYTRLNEVVQEQLSATEAAIQTERTESLGTIEARLDHLYQIISAKREELQNETAGQLEEVQLQIETQRDELRDLKVRELINESRYRELEDKWPRCSRPTWALRRSMTL